MTFEENNNHFCIYCGSRIEPGQNFCAECGKPVYKKEHTIKKQPSKYDVKIDELEKQYNDKQSKASQLVENLFDPNHMAYERFTSSIKKSNNLFDIQVGIARKMAEMDINDNPFIVKEMETKLQTLHAFIDKMEDLTSELVIHLSSNKKDTEDINNLFSDMDDLIDSVKDY